MQQEYLANGTAVCINSATRFGQDALLLAHFCRVRRAERVCDLGTGCGIVPLYWHDRGHTGPCLALERNGDALALLRAALALPQQAEAAAHITPLHADLRHSAVLHPYAQSCNVVACNPPYFTAGFISPNAARAGARHQLTCTPDDVCTAARILLRDGGRLCMCQRPDRLTDVLCAMRKAGIEPKRLQLVAARADKEPWLVLVEGQKNRAPGLRTLPTLITTRPDGRPSKAMLDVYGYASPRPLCSDAAEQAKENAP
jgi:tRNA1(Val) A37 N6-methylase TrmN6